MKKNSGMKKVIINGIKGREGGKREKQAARGKASGGRGRKGRNKRKKARERFLTLLFASMLLCVRLHSHASLPPMVGTKNDENNEKFVQFSGEEGGSKVILLIPFNFETVSVI